MNSRLFTAVAVATVLGATNSPLSAKAEEVTQPTTIVEDVVTTTDTTTEVKPVEVPKEEVTTVIEQPKEEIEPIENVPKEDDTLAPAPVEDIVTTTDRAEEIKPQDTPKEDVVTTIPDTTEVKPIETPKEEVTNYPQDDTTTSVKEFTQVLNTVDTKEELKTIITNTSKIDDTQKEIILSNLENVESSEEIEKVKEEVKKTLLPKTSAIPKPKQDNSIAYILSTLLTTLGIFNLRKVK